MLAPQAKFAPDPRRRSMIAKVKIAQKELRLDEPTYRAMLERLTGQTSAAACTEAQLARVLDELKAKGWSPTGAHRARSGAAPEPRTRRPADHPVAKKARAMWISLHQLGVVRDPSERALEAFARRQLGVERLQWADQRQGYRLVEALKAMAERAGWSQDVAGVDPALQVRTLKRRLVLALQERLGLALFSAADLARVPQDRLDQLTVEFAGQLKAAEGR